MPAAAIATRPYTDSTTLDGSPSPRGEGRDEGERNTDFSHLHRRFNNSKTINAGKRFHMAPSPSGTIESPIHHSNASNTLRVQAIDVDHLLLFYFEWNCPRHEISRTVIPLMKSRRGDMLSQKFAAGRCAAATWE
jgi:hypothetical protein